MDKTNPETPSDSTAILDKINNGELTVKGNKPKAKKPDKPKEAEVVKEKAKPNPKSEKTETPAFPAAAKINDYGFLHFKNAWLETLSWHKGMALKIDKNADDSMTLRKA